MPFNLNTVTLFFGGEILSHFKTTLTRANNKTLYTNLQ